MKVRAKTKWEMWEITFRSLRPFLSVPFPKNGRNLQKFPNFKNLHSKSLQNVNCHVKHGTDILVLLLRGVCFFVFLRLGNFCRLRPFFGKGTDRNGRNERNVISHISHFLPHKMFASIKSFLYLFEHNLDPPPFSN